MDKKRAQDKYTRGSACVQHEMPRNRFMCGKLMFNTNYCGAFLSSIHLAALSDTLALNERRRDKSETQLWQ